MLQVIHRASVGLRNKGMITCAVERAEVRLPSLMIAASLKWYNSTQLLAMTILHIALLDGHDV